MLSRLKFQIFSDRIGPDLLFTHWLLYFPTLGKILIRKKVAKVGLNVDIRPHVTIVSGKNVELGSNITLRPGTQIHADPKKNGAKVIIENNVLIGPNVLITTNRHNYEDIKRPIIAQGGLSKSIRIKEGSWIAANVIILPGVIIGKNSVIAAGAVVTKSIPDYVIAAGIPAKEIKKLKSS